jgi:hypothetical protein
VSIYADNLREFFNHDVTDAAAAEIDSLEQEIDRLTLIINRCKTVMAVNDPMNYRIIFEAK